ncbi:hypothetical protein [Actinoplanes sp. DH11]|uniref:hypothetical protein n=1 Tax=Actinoplanes sp. DH11 TaxID=2857011 RepID=UPI001E37B521|nr:hypothetical protein [Actinoplanes sp. DH11]
MIASSPSSGRQGGLSGGMFRGRRDDLFGGRTAPRLRRIERELAAAVTDAQSRDWAADRPDRVGFARLGQVRHEVAQARRHQRSVVVPRVPAAFLVVWLALVTTLLLRGGDPSHPPVLAAATAVALGAVLAVTAAARGLRRARARRAPGTPAVIDDPYLYPELRRRLEGCAVAARSDNSYRRRAAATDLEYALDWLAAAEEELPRRP